MLRLPFQLRSARRLGAPLTGVLRSYGDMLFLGRPAAGAIIMLGTLADWRIGLAGLLCVAGAVGFVWTARLDLRCFQSSAYLYNPLLVGLGLGATWSWSWLTALLTLIAGAMAWLLTAVLAHLLRTHCSLPVLSLPFVAASAVVQTAMLKYSAISPRSAPLPDMLLDDGGLPLLLAGFFKSLAAILFLPSVPVGVLVSLALLWRSRILFFLAVGGYGLGLAMRTAMLGSFEQAAFDLSGFNFMLVAMALGGVFLIPSWSSFLIAAAATVMTVFLTDALGQIGYVLGVPVYTLPFNLVVLGAVYALGVSQFAGLSRQLDGTPEETVENELIRRLRFPDAGRSLSLPFLGKWTVWQGADDEWTHKGDWRHAYDFVVADDEGQTHSEGGMQLKDFYSYRKPVLSPCRGAVVSAVDDLPDNPIGRVDKEHNWGNHLILWDDRGFYVELSHFAQGSLQVKAGERVELGQALGLCGNSGYSPQPHLHIHVQAGPQLGSATLPFQFAKVVEGDLFHSLCKPEKGCRLESAAIDRALDAATDFLLNETLEFEVRRHGVAEADLSLIVKMALDGTLYFESDRGGKLYFGKHDGAFFFYRLDGRDERLKTLLLALPRLPLIRGRQTAWRDAVPVGLAAKGWRKALAQTLAPLAAEAATVRTSHRYVGRSVIETRIEAPWLGIQRVARVELDERRGLASIRLEEWELRLRRDRQEQTVRDGAVEPARTVEPNAAAHDAQRVAIAPGGAPPLTV